LLNEEFVFAYIIKKDSTTYKEAMKFVDVVFWKEAINSELDSFLSNYTWMLTNLRLGCKPLGCKWVFEKKLTADRNY